MNGHAVGPAGAKEFIGRLREAFPDITFTVEKMIAEGDLVATRWTATGTNDGEFMGHEPTGRQRTIDGITIQRFESGRIVEGWTQQDALGLFRLIGALPQPARVWPARQRAPPSRASPRGEGPCPAGAREGRRQAARENRE